GALEEGGVPLVGVAADEAVEVLEAQPGRPEVERPVLAGVPVGDVVVLSIPRRVVAVAPQHLGHRAAAFGHERVVAGVTRPELHDGAGGATVMVAARDERGP